MAARRERPAPSREQTIRYLSKVASALERGVPPEHVAYRVRRWVDRANNKIERGR